MANSKTVPGMTENGHLFFEPIFGAELKIEVPAKKNVWRGFWKNLNNQKRFIESIAPKFNISDLGDWYNVTGRQIAKEGSR